ncbi:hypothetical protein [Staphylococcus aureus]|uniref:hypothetical protein n=1 Tax=Staphylococcus aureus TaxID=1280 RepID=UPI002270481D|nr:hypothetical protein [Staphylococcus aureus]
MGNLDFDHEGYRKLLPLKEYKDSIKHSDSKTRNHFIGMAFNNKTDVFSRNFFNKMINIFPKKNFIFIYNNFQRMTALLIWYTTMILQHLFSLG